VFPAVALSAAGSRDLVALEEDSLGDSGVLNTVLNDVHGVVIKVVVDNATTNTVVFSGVFNNGLLEVGLEVENLNLQFQLASFE